MSGELFSGLLLDDTDQRALALEAVLGQVVDDDTRVVWVGNPLRSPLKIERFLIQIVGPEVDLREQRGPADFARIVATQVGRATRLLIVVQQPETIDAETRDALVEMGGYLGGEAVQVQFLFAGSSSFRVPQLAQPVFAEFSSRMLNPETEPISCATRRRDVVPLLLLLLATTIGVLFFVTPISHEGMPPQVTAAASTKDVSPLRREFDTYLAERIPALPPMTEADKEALFNGFLTYHRRE